MVKEEYLDMTAPASTNRYAAYLGGLSLISN